MMITFDKGEKRFNYRVAGVAIEDGKVLVHKAEGEPFRTFPGGRAEWGEPAAQALQREMLEELDLEVEVVRLLWVVENFFEHADKSYHEIAFYFLMRLPAGFRSANQVQAIYGSDENLELTFRWVANDPKTLADLHLQPSFLRQALQALPEVTQHVVHWDKNPLE